MAVSWLAMAQCESERLGAHTFLTDGAHTFRVNSVVQTQEKVQWGVGEE